MSSPPPTKLKIKAQEGISWYDSHCHFDFKAFDDIRPTLWENCLKDGCVGLIIPGIHPKQWSKAFQIATELPNIWIAIGLHPWWINKMEKERQNFPIHQPNNILWENHYELLHHSSTVAIGECGLDALIECSMDHQLDVLNQHLELSHQLKMPIILHCRKAHNELIQAIKKYSLSGVIHGFSGSVDLAKQYIQLGFKIGVGGVITYSRAKKTRETIKQLPLEDLLLETDAPDMPLMGHQGQNNSPLNIPLILEEIATLKALSKYDVSHQLVENFKQLFPGISV